MGKIITELNLVEAFDRCGGPCKEEKKSSTYVIRFYTGYDVRDLSRMFISGLNNGDFDDGYREGQFKYGRAKTISLAKLKTIIDQEGWLKRRERKFRAEDHWFRIYDGKDCFKPRVWFYFNKDWRYDSPALCIDIKKFEDPEEVERVISPFVKEIDLEQIIKEIGLERRLLTIEVV